MTYVIALSNEKGGVAKTTTSLSLGSALAGMNHRVLLVDLDSQAEYFSTYSLGKMMSLIRYIRKETNPELAYRILVTLLDLRNRVHLNMLNHIQRVFGETLFETRIEIDTKIRESQTEGIPIIKYIPSTRGSIQYMSLAQELLEYVEKV